MDERPKQPANAYFKFRNDFMAQDKKDYPDDKFAERNERCKTEWDNIDPKLKEKLEAEYKKEKEVK